MPEIEKALFIEKMIGKKEMERLNDLARDSKAKSWLVGDLENQKIILQNYEKI